MKGLFLVIVILTSIVSNVKGYEIVRGSYSVDTKSVEAVEKLNEYFLSLGGGNFNKVVIKQPGIESAKFIDTYFDDMSGLYIIQPQDLTVLQREKQIRVSELSLREPIWGSLYNRTNHLEYIIVYNDDIFPFFTLANVEKIEGLSQKDFKVYRNLKPEFISVQERNDFSIEFTGEAYNATEYVKNGISHKEDGFSWTDGDSLVIKVPVPQLEEKAYNAKVSFIGTFNGQQRMLIKDTKGFEILNERCEGKGSVDFTVSAKNGFIHFIAEFPDARVIKELIPESTDPRKVAFQLKTILFQEVGN